MSSSDIDVHGHGFLERSSVNNPVMTRPGMDNWGIVFRIPTMTRIFRCPKRRTGLYPRLLSYSIRRGIFFHVV